MTDPPPVVCAGIVVADHLCTPIDHLPAAGELVAAEELVLSLGGCASNAAVDLAKLGVQARVCGRVGDDAFGRFVAETLRGHGVDVRGLAVDPGRATSQTLIINVRGEDRRFVHSFGANRAFAIDDLDAALATPPRVLYVGGYLILPALEPEALADCFRRVRARGALTVLDVATPGKGDYLPMLEPVLPHTDVFLPNTDEAALILGEDDPVLQAEAFRTMGARRVVITLGEDGAVAVSDALRLHLGVFPMPFVDGSGGGDAFDAGYIAGLLDGRDELGCLTLASAVGASCVRAVGTTTGVFTRAEVEAYLARHSLPVRPL
jgi:sugar/nucleoside kinase (ribokinase family)